MIYIRFIAIFKGTIMSIRCVFIHEPSRQRCHNGIRPPEFLGIPIAIKREHPNSIFGSCVLLSQTWLAQKLDWWRWVMHGFVLQMSLLFYLCPKKNLRPIQYSINLHPGPRTQYVDLRLKMSWLICGFNPATKTTGDQPMCGLEKQHVKPPVQHWCCTIFFVS